MIMKVIENIKDDYNDSTWGGTESQLISIGRIIMFLPAIMIGDNKYKIIRLIGLMVSLVWMIPMIPIIAFFALTGLVQFVWQNI
jgi:hypothetical protein